MSLRRFNANPMRKDLTQERVKSLLYYDPETGALTWTEGGRNRWHGRPAGYKDPKGYIHIRVDDKLRKAHRVIWLYMTGKWPEHFIDHINGDRADNRFCNLREATASQNQTNKTVASVQRKHGTKRGVYWNAQCKRWGAKVQVNKRCYWLGTFATEEEAHAVYLAAAERLQGEYRHKEARHCEGVINAS
jgi:hypothetical protein